MRVLILDDNFSMFLNLVLIYGDMLGVEFVAVATPKEAEALLQKQAFDAMLLDGDLGNTVPTGPALLKDWKQRGLAPKEVFMISGDAQLNAEGMAAGACHILGKGADSDLLPNDWPSAIRKHLEEVS
jgi:DNA-binding NtrC family response regulator